MNWSSPTALSSDSAFLGSLSLRSSNLCLICSSSSLCKYKILIMNRMSLILQQTKYGHKVCRHHQLAFALGWACSHLLVSPKPGSERGYWCHQNLCAPIQYGIINQYSPRRPLVGVVGFLINWHNDVFGVLVDDGEAAVQLLPHPNTLPHQLLHLGEKSLLSILDHILAFVAVDVHPLLVRFHLRQVWDKFHYVPRCPYFLSELVYSLIFWAIPWSHTDGAIFAHKPLNIDLLHSGIALSWPTLPRLSLLGGAHLKRGSHEMFIILRKCDLLKNFSEQKNC